MSFHVRRDPLGAVRVSMSSGDLDGEVAQGLHRILTELVQAGGPVVFDAGTLESVGAAGVRALVGAATVARRTGSRFVIENAPRRLVRLLELAELDELLRSARLERSGSHASGSNSPQEGRRQGLGR